MVIGEVRPLPVGKEAFSVAKSLYFLDNHHGRRQLLSTAEAIVADNKDIATLPQCLPN